MNKALVVVNILLAIGYINSSAAESCKLYPIHQLNLVKNHKHQFQKIFVDENINDENLDVCLSLYEDSYKHLNTIQLSLINTNNNSSRASPTLFYKQWFDINLRDNNPLCVSYQNLQNIKLTLQLQINIKRSGQHHLIVRNMKVCHTPLQTNLADAPWPPLSTKIPTETTKINEPDGKWTVPTWPIREPSNPWSVPTWPSTPSKDTTTTTTTTKKPSGDWTVPTWPLSN